MHRVASIAIRAIAEGASRVSGVAIEDLFQGSPVSFEEIKSNKWISWETFCTWITYLDDSRWAPFDWTQVGQATAQEQSISALKPLFRMTASMRLAYWLAGKWFGPSQFPGISCEVKDTGPRLLQETLTLHPDLMPCPQVFKVFQGCLTVLPEAIFSLPPSVVVANYTERQAVYVISLPPEQSFWSQARFFVRSLFNVRALFREIVTQQENLQVQSNRILIERSEFQNLIDRFPDGVIIHNHGHIRYVNPCFAKYLHCTSPRQLVGQQLMDYIHIDDHPEVLQRIKRLEENPKAVNPSREFRFHCIDSDEIFIGECTALSTVFEGTPTVAVAVRDVSDRKKLQAHMMLTDRMRDLGQLAAGVGHEVNNPLFYVMLKAENLEKTLSSENQTAAAEQVHEIQQGLQRIQAIVRQLKTFSRIEPDAGMSLIQLKENISSAIGMARNTIEHRAQLKVEIEENLPFIRGNAARLSQVFLNLLINAAQSIEPGHARSNWIQVRVFQDRGSEPAQVVIEISDTGSGISESAKENLFQPFFTTKPVGEGTGLGLSISHSIVTQHLGQISFEANHVDGLERGTVFRVRLPVPEADSVESRLQNASLKNSKYAPALPSAPTPAAFHSGRILLIDDDPDLLEVLESVISTRHEIVALLDATEALMRIQKGEKFDCILCDLMMPNLGGVDFYQQLREISPEHCQKIVFMTGGSFTPRTDQFLKTEGILSKEKPISTTELMSLIQSILKPPATQPAG